MTKKSSRMVRVTPRARDDLKNIGHYTEQTWDKAQRNRYLKSIDARFHWLAENPQLVKHRTDICQGYYNLPEGQHVVFYLVNSNAIDIIGVPHKDWTSSVIFSKDDNSVQNKKNPETTSDNHSQPASAKRLSNAFSYGSLPPSRNAKPYFQVTLSLSNIFAGVLNVDFSIHIHPLIFKISITHIKSSILISK